MSYDWQPLLLTFKLAGVTTLILSFIGYSFCLVVVANKNTFQARAGDLGQHASGVAAFCAGLLSAAGHSARHTGSAISWIKPSAETRVQF